MYTIYNKDLYTKIVKYSFIYFLHEPNWRGGMLGPRPRLDPPMGHLSILMQCEDQPWHAVSN